MKYLILIIAFNAAITGCKKQNNNLTSTGPTELLNEEERISQEYAVLNQTFPQINENIALFNYNIPHIPTTDSFVGKDFRKRYGDSLWFLLIDYYQELDVDIRDIPTWFIDFIAFDDSLVQFKDLASRRLDLNRINHPDHAIFLALHPEFNDVAMERDKMRPIYIEISRVLISDDEKKAEYHLGITRGRLNGIGLHVFAEFRNGAWFVVRQEVTWIS